MMRKECRRGPRSKLATGFVTALGVTLAVVMVGISTASACSYSRPQKERKETSSSTKTSPTTTSTVPESIDSATDPDGDSGSDSGSEETAEETPEEAPATPAKIATKPRPSVSNASVAKWEEAFLGRWNEEDEDEYRAMSTSSDSWQFYNLAYAIDANVSMFQATGKTQYLDRALLYVNNVVKTARPSSILANSQFSDSYLGWAQHSHPQLGDDGQEYPLYESYMWRYVTNMLLAMKQDASVSKDPKYAAQYKELLAFTERNIFDKWQSRDEEHIYRSHTHMFSHWAMISFDLSLLATDANRVAKYKTVYNRFDADMRKQLEKTSIGGYFWDAPWGSHDHPGQDVSHGNAVMAYVVHANAEGSKAWTDADMKAFVITLNKTIWPSAGKVGEYVDGSGNGNGWFNDGFVDLGRFDSALQQRLEQNKVGQNIQLFASLALNAQLLSHSS